MTKKLISMLLLSQTEDKEELINKKEDNNSENKEQKNMNLAEEMTTMIGQGKIVETIVEGTDKIEAVKIIEEIKEETTDPEISLLFKVMLSAQQDSFPMSLSMTS